MQCVIRRTRLPQWPPPKPVVLLEGPYKAQRIVVEGRPDGRLYTAIHSDSVKTEFLSQQVCPTNRGWLVMTISWTDSEASILINNKELAPASETEGVFEVTPTATPPEQATSSPAARKACEQWMSWRKKRFAQPVPARAGFRSKSNEEQLEELEKAAAALDDLSNVVRQGRTHLLGTLAAILRALVHWNGRRQYNPLLLRIAGRYDMPLPVYMIPGKDPIPSFIADADQIVMQDLSVTKEFGTQELADLQEGLETALVRLRVGEEGPEQETYTLRETIAAVAETQGVAHFDEDFPLILGPLYSMRSGTAYEIVHNLVWTADVVSQLADYVVSTVRESS